MAKETTKKSKVTEESEAKSKTEEYKVKGKDLMTKIKEIIKEGNAKNITIKNSSGKDVLRIPVTLGVVGAVLAPYLAAIGFLAAILTNCSIIVEKR